MIVPIVEGHGEVRAVPILLRRWLRHRNFHRYLDVHLDGPVRASGKGALKVPHNADEELGIEHYVEIALPRRPDAIIVILDIDDDAPEILGPQLLRRARANVPVDFPLCVVLARREYEAGFLSTFPCSRFRAGLEALGFELSRRSLPRGIDVEAISDCIGIRGQTDRDQLALGRAACERVCK
ncbi:MAG: hypothetical protein ACP5XB_03140 [Isosphaeraceae bacterium]